jgi:hypothetical protein
MDDESPQRDEDREERPMDRWCRQVREVAVSTTPPLVALATLVHELRELFT